MMRWMVSLCALVAVGLSWGQGIVWRSYKNFAISKGKVQREVVLQTQGAFDTYWRELTGEPSAPRDVDFSKEFLIAVQMGERPSMGYKVLIRSIERTKPNEITVTWEERKPDPSGINAAVMTAPYEIVRVERKNANGVIVFKKREATQTGGGSPGTGLRWRTLQCGITGGGRNEFARAFRDLREFERYWTIENLEGSLPDIDFQQEMILAIHLGERPSDGYDVVVDDIAPVPGGFVVTYIEKAPSVGQRTRPKATSPYVIIRLPLLAGEITFRKRVWRSDGE